VPAPPAFPGDAPVTSKHLNSSAAVLDGSFVEIFSTVDRAMSNDHSIKCSNKFTDNDKASSVLIAVMVTDCGYVSEITVLYLVLMPPLSGADSQ
jgi:hypothetical protein